MKMIVVSFFFFFFKTDFIDATDKINYITIHNNILDNSW